MIAIGKNQTKWRKNNWFTWVFPVYEGMGIGNNWAGFHAYSHKDGFAMLSNEDNCPIGWLLGKPLDDQSPETISFLNSIL